MKSEIKKSFCFLFLVITYSLQAIVNAYSFSYIYILSFMVCVALLYVIRNKYVSMLAGVIILVAVEFYNADYKYLTILAFLLICAHKNLISDINSDHRNKKATSTFSFLCVQLALFATIAVYIYSLYLLANTDINFFSIIQSARVILILFWLVGIFIYSLFRNRSDKKQKSSHKINKRFSGSLRFIYLVSIFAFGATLMFCYYKIGHINISHEVIFFPWFVYICSMIYNGDPYIDSLAKSIEMLLSKISDKDKVKK